MALLSPYITTGNTYFHEVKKTLPPVHDGACVFCRIAAGTAPAEVIIRTPRVLAILDLHPIHRGHALIIPRDHHQDVLSIPDDLLAEMSRTSRDVARALVEVLGLEGFNVFSNNGRIAGQSVFHAHIHVTPRYPQDGIRFVPVHTRYGAGEMAQMGARLREGLTSFRHTQGE